MLFVYIPFLSLIYFAKEYLINLHVSSMQKKKKNFEELVFTFLKIEIHFMRGWTATEGRKLKEKRSTQRLKHTGNLFKKYLQLKRQKKAFYWQIISESSCVRKETVDITILATYRNLWQKDHAIYQYNE